MAGKGVWWREKQAVNHTAAFTVKKQGQVKVIFLLSVEFRTSAQGMVLLTVKVGVSTLINQNPDKPSQVCSEANLKTPSQACTGASLFGYSRSSQVGN